MDETESVPSTSQEDNEPQPSVNETTPARVNVPQGKKEEGRPRIHSKRAVVYSGKTQFGIARTGKS